MNYLYMNLLGEKPGVVGGFAGLYCPHVWTVRGE